MVFPDGNPPAKGRAREGWWVRGKIICQDKVQYHIEVLSWRGFCEQQRLSQFHGCLLCRVLCLETENKARISDLCLCPDCALGSGSEGHCRKPWGLWWILAELLTLMWSFGDKAGLATNWRGHLGCSDETPSHPHSWAVQMLCRGALCLQFTCFTTFPRAGLGSSPQWEEIVGIFFPALMFIPYGEVCHALIFNTCLHGCWDKSSKTVSSNPILCKAAKLLWSPGDAGVGGWGSSSRQPRWAVGMLSLRAGEVHRPWNNICTSK